MLQYRSKRPSSTDDTQDEKPERGVACVLFQSHNWEQSRCSTPTADKKALYPKTKMAGKILAASFSFFPFADLLPCAVYFLFYLKIWIHCVFFFILHICVLSHIYFCYLYSILTIYSILCWKQIPKYSLILNLTDTNGLSLSDSE